MIIERSCFHMYIIRHIKEKKKKKLQKEREKKWEGYNILHTFIAKHVCSKTKDRFNRLLRSFLLLFFFLLFSLIFCFLDETLICCCPLTLRQRSYRTPLTQKLFSSSSSAKSDEENFKTEGRINKRNERLHTPPHPAHRPGTQNRWEEQSPMKEISHREFNSGLKISLLHNLFDGHEQLHVCDSVGQRWTNQNISSVANSRSVSMLIPPPIPYQLKAYKERKAKSQ